MRNYKLTEKVEKLWVETKKKCKKNKEKIYINLREEKTLRHSTYKK